MKESKRNGAEHHFLEDILLFQGGMGIGVSLGGLAGAVAAEGGAGTISTAQIGFREPDFYEAPLKANLRAIGKELKKAREIAGGNGLIGVNIMTVTKHYGEYVKEAIAQRADFIVSGAGLPMDLPSLAKGSSIKLIPIVSSLKAAAVICRRWLKKDGVLPDAVIIEGPLAGGHLGFDAQTAAEEGTVVKTVETAKITETKETPEVLNIFEEEVKNIISYMRELGEKEGKYIPVITAGGFRIPKDQEEQKKLGADKIQIASRFVTTKECDAHPAFKQAYLNCRKEDISIIKSPVGMPGRAIRNFFIKQVTEQRMPPVKCLNCISVCKPAEIPYCITQALIKAVSGDSENGLVFCGANAWQEEQITTVKQIMDEFRGDCKQSINERPPI